MTRIACESDESSAWLEYFAAGPQAAQVAAAIENVEQLLVPTIVFIEVTRRGTFDADFVDLPGVKYFAKRK